MVFKHMDMVSNVENICILINPLNNLQNHLLRLSRLNSMKIEEDFHYFKLCVHYVVISLIYCFKLLYNPGFVST